MALTLNIGNAGSPALVQQSASTLNAAAILPGPSTAGNCLIAVLGSSTGIGGVAPSGSGWRLLASKDQGGAAHVEIWAYPSNPGGIQTVSFGPSISENSLSEWSDVSSAATLDGSGSASATSGTTLAPTTSGNLTTTNDLAISAWVQVIAAPGSVTFTTPATFTRVKDDGIQVGNAFHLDIEYKINPATGAPLGPTLTSTGTTTSAAGVIVALRTNPPIADQANYLVYDSLSLQLNTLDFALIDCPTAIPNSATVTLSSPGEYPDWTGTVASVEARNVVDRTTGHHLQVISATNTNPPNFTMSPFDLSDNPAADTTLEIGLEDGSGGIMLEDGTGALLTEGVLEYPYADLSIRTQNASTTPPISYTTFGYVTVFQVGFWPGMTFKLTSSNLNSWILAAGASYTVRSIVVTYHGVNPPTPVYRVQFGDLVQTLTQWIRTGAL